MNSVSDLHLFNLCYFHVMNSTLDMRALLIFSAIILSSVSARIRKADQSNSTEPTTNAPEATTTFTSVILNEEGQVTV